LLGPEIRLLAVLRWILESIPPGDRWLEVFTRYVDTVVERVRAFGGDPDSVRPDPAGGEHGGEGHHGGDGDRQRHVRGKVVEIRYDCAGDFIGVVLWSCGHHHHVASSRRGVEQLMRTALRHDLTVDVRMDEHDGPESFTLLG